MEVVDSVPRRTNSKGYIGSLSLKERVVDVGLKISGSWGANWGVHERGTNGRAKREPHLYRKEVASTPTFRVSHWTLMSAHPPSRFSVLSSSSLSSAELLSPTNTSARFSLPSAPSITTATTGNQKALSRPNIYDRPLNKTRTAEVSAPAFAFLFSEVVQYMQKRVSGINDLERRQVSTPL